MSDLQDTYLKAATSKAWPSDTQQRWDCVVAMLKAEGFEVRARHDIDAAGGCMMVEAGRNGVTNEVRFGYKGDNTPLSFGSFLRQSWEGMKIMTPLLLARLAHGYYEGNESFRSRGLPVPSYDWSSYMTYATSDAGTGKALTFNLETERGARKMAAFVVQQLGQKKNTLTLAQPDAWASPSA